MDVCPLPYPERFHAAVSFVLNPLDGNLVFPDETRLVLYALNQQATRGPCKDPKPWGWNVVETAKWQSWSQLGDMAAVEAMRLYVKVLEQSQPDWWVIAGAGEKQAGSGGPYQGLQEAATAGAWVAPYVRGNKRPPPRYEHGAALTGRQMWVVGGNFGGRYLSDVWVLNLDSLAWTLASGPQAAAAAPPTPLPVSKGAGRGLLFSHIRLLAHSASEVPTSEGPQPPAGTPQEAATAPAAEGLGAAAAEPTAGPPAPGGEPGQPCAGHAVVAWQGKLYCIGGHVKRAGRAAPAKGKEEGLAVRVFDPETRAWEALRPGGSAPKQRGGHTATLIGSRVYVFGGEDAARRPLGDLLVLDLEACAWAAPDTEGKAPAPRAAHAASAYQDRYLLLFGGGSVAHCFADLHILDTVSNTWTAVRAEGAVPPPRAGHAAAVLGSRWYIVGGGNNAAGCADLHALDLTPLGTGPLRWELLAEAEGRSALASEGLSLLGCEEGACLLAFGGYNGKYHNAVQLYTPGPGRKAAEVGMAAAKAKGAKAPKGAPKGAAASSKPEANGVVPKLAAPAEDKAEASAKVEADAALRTAQAEAAAAREAAQKVQREAAGAKEAAAAEMALMRRQLASAQAATADAEQRAEAAAGEASAEAAKVFRLEVALAEAQRAQQRCADLEKEAAQLRKLLQEAEDQGKQGKGIWGYISGAQ